jgi:MFS family permease
MKQSKITFLTSIGAGLEYYDYVLYSLLAGFISQQFFPSTNRVASLFATFGVFAIGNIIRPLGGIVFGMFGDRFGRKNVFANTLLWMAFATVLMGLLPNFSTIGITATILFSLCRIVQGVTCGAEIPGAVTFLSEHIDTKSHGKNFGFMVSFISLGVTFGTFVVWICTKLLTNAQMSSFGFRLPYLLGGVLAIVGFLIRKQVPETPAFLAMKKIDSKTVSIFSKNNISLIINTIGILIFPASLITFFLVLPVYLHDTYSYSFSVIYLTMTIGYLWSSFLLPIFGFFSDYIGRKRLLIITAILFIIFAFPIFSLLSLKTFWALLLFKLLIQTVIAAMAASYFALLPQVFPTAIRYTGTAFSYNIAYTIVAILPLVVNYVYGVVKKPNYMIGLFMVLAAITVGCALRFKPHADGS